MSTRKRLRPEDYTVGWLCALAWTEQVAAIKMLDEQHQELPKPTRDFNTYTYGSIGSHNIVIACLPLSHPGTTSATRMADLLPMSFPNLKLYLFVGVGGGIPRNPPDPDASRDIHLGDVVVGVGETPGIAGVVQYDFIRDQGEGAREQLGRLDKPNPELLTALGKLFSNYEMGDSNPHVHLAKLTGLRSDFSRPPPGGDKLYRSTYKHILDSPNCDNCSADELVVRNERQPEAETAIPVFHQGQILSGNSVIKYASRRDELSREYPHARCFEMEAAGVVDQTHCLVIRGISDYADSHKNQQWQPYAAGTAAAFARELLLTVQASVVAHLGAIAPTGGEAGDLRSIGPLESDNVHWMVPKCTNKLFTGREDILEKLGRSLVSPSHTSQISDYQKRFVISGYGGIGKSEVCLKFANDHRQHFWGIFWIDASSEETAKQAFVHIGRLCGADAESFEQVKTWLANIRHSWLLIIDNADNPNIDYSAFFPSGIKGNIILTTRNTQFCDYESIGFEDLDHLDLQNATSLLFKAAGIAESSRERNQKAAEKVVRDLGFHTLAVIQAGAFVKLRFCTLEEYPIIFKQQEDRLLRYHPNQAQSTYGSVFATFEISATQLESSKEQSAADALSLLRIMGFIHFQEIPEVMFSRARKEAIAIQEEIGRGRLRDEIHQLSESQISRLPLFIMHMNDTATDLFLWRWREMLNLLESYSIVKVSGSGEELSFSMHPLAHTWTRIRHGLEARKEGWRGAGSVIALSMRGLDYDVFHEKLRSHVGTYLDHLVTEYVADMTELEICQTYSRICFLLLNSDNILKLRFLLQMLETFKLWTAPSEDSIQIITLLTAQCYIREGQYKRAIEQLERLVETDPSHDLYWQSLLADAYIASKKHQKAIILLEHIIEVREKTEAPERSSLLWSQLELGYAYYGNEEYERAATVLKKVVEIRKRTLMPTHWSRLASECQLGRAYIGTKQYEKAAELLEQVFEIRRTTLNAKHPFLLGTKYELARAYVGMGNGHYGRAAELLEPVVSIREETLAPDDPQLLISRYWLAKAYIGMEDGQNERAAKLLEKVVEADGTMLALARAYISMRNGHNGRAAELLEKVVQVDGKVPAPDHPARLESQQLLEGVYKRIEIENDTKSTSTSGENV